MPLNRIIITTGDVDGIGVEVTLKALRKIKIPKNCSIFIYSQSPLNQKNKRLSLAHFSSFEDADSSANETSKIFNIVSNRPPPFWVEEAASLCLRKKADVLVTGPLSKDLILSSGMKDIGHTDILQRVSHQSGAKMAFLGSRFNVILATGHKPLSEVESSLSVSSIQKVLNLALSSRKVLDTKKQTLPVCLLGLNPHAGDGGIIGSFENDILKKALKGFSEKDVVGPMVPDIAFHSKNWNKYSFYIALYHDQGLIPFKMVHGFGGVHMTLGLKIKRVSVDHGTAKDIFGKGLADASSMIDAINFGMKLAST